MPLGLQRHLVDLSVWWPRRYLLGPVSAEFPGRFLRGAAECDRARFFGNGAGLHTGRGEGDNWETRVLSRSGGVVPDFLAFWLPHTSIPDWLWAAPVPL